MGRDEQLVVAVAGIIVDEGRRVLLMRRRSTGNWEPPGGAVKLGEGLQEALVREVREETRVKVTAGRPTGLYQNTETGVLTIAFRCTPNGGSPSPTEEAAEVRWADEHEAANLLMEDYLQWLKDSSTDGVAVRKQTETVKGASSSPHAEL